MRRFFVRLTTSLALATLAAGQALASGGLSCETDAGDGVVLTIQSGITRGMGGPLFQFSADIELKDTAVPDDLRRMHFSDEHVPQYWLDQTSLKLVLYRERPADKEHGYVEVTMQTQPRDSDEGTYGGSVDVTVFDVGPPGSVEGKTVKLSAPISCFVE